jgi:hypothetical protein
VDVGARPEGSRLLLWSVIGAVTAVAVGGLLRSIQLTDAGPLTDYLFGHQAQVCTDVTVEVVDSVSDGLLGSTCETVERVFTDCQPGPHAPELLSNMLGASAESLAGLYALAKGGR